RGSTPEPVAIGSDVSQWALEGRELFVLLGGAWRQSRKYQYEPRGRLRPAHRPPIEPDVTAHCSHGSTSLVSLLRNPRLDKARIGRRHPSATGLSARKPSTWANLGSSQPYD